MVDSQSVLIVGGPAETEEVLRAILEPRGLCVSRLDSHEVQRPLPCSPDVIVLHATTVREATPQHCWSEVPHVVIGNMSHQSNAEEGCRRLRDPFHYGDLITAIDDLLKGARRFPLA